MAAVETGLAGNPCPQTSVHHPALDTVSIVARGSICSHGAMGLHAQMWAMAMSQSRGRAVGTGERQTTKAEADSQVKPTGRLDGKPRGSLEAKVMHNQHAFGSLQLQLYLLVHKCTTL